MTRCRIVHYVLLLAVGLCGCKSFSVTAVHEGQCHGDDPKGIPFYMPKPLLIISKNFQYIEESKVGLTDSPPIPKGFDNQAGFASLNAAASLSRVESDKPAGAITVTHTEGDVSIEAGDADKSAPRLHSGGAPVSPKKSQVLDFKRPIFTYQIVFVPDLTQKHYLRIKGGPGEVRATMNLVNGWMYTGLGPFYLKDSSTAQNILATGVAANFAAGGAADVINSVADLSRVLNANGETDSTAYKMAAESFKSACEAAKADLIPKDTCCIEAEIHIFESHVGPDGEMLWREINPTATCFSGKMLGKNDMAEWPRNAAMQEKALAMYEKQLDAHSQMRLAQAPQQAMAKSAVQLMMAESATRPTDAAEAAAVVQALTPPTTWKRSRLADCLWGKRGQIVNKQAIGPTITNIP